MASTKTEHLTSLSFNLTDMKAQLDSIPASVQEAAIKAQKAWDDNFKAGSGTGTGTGSGSNSSGGGSDDAEAASLSATKSRLESLLLSYKNFQATLANSKLDPTELQSLRTTVDTSIESIERLSGSLNENGKLAKEDAAEYRELVSTLKELKGAHADLKTDMGDSQKGTKGETVITATKSQLESLILQYKNFEATLSRTKIYPEAIGTLKTTTAEATTQLVGLTDQLDANGKLTGESAQKYQDFTSKLKGAKGEFADLSKKANEAAGATNNVGASADKAGGFLSNFLGKLADKARWLAAFYLIQSVINGFQQLVSTIKDTETAVVEIQRVMNEDVSSANVSKELYAIAYEYGRTFEEVQESATLFAQTGKSWNDVLTLTRGTMLALNTAELDVTQATEGLIAVMAQWNMGAEDYVGVIDKINKTADDYAITSEKIVAALQRSGGTAKAYGMTLDELIGIITALGEATGRSGENIGTAINSLITYTTKAKSIKVLENMGIEAKDAEGNLLPVLDIWSQLAQKIKGGDLAFADFMATDQEAMDAFLADSEEYQQAVKDTIASGKEVQDAYSIAGTYRKNYFIALLNNLGTAEKAMIGMADAEGYSAIENAKQMETLVNRSNQFAAVWKDAATQLGDAGVLDLIKFFVSVGTEIGKVTQETGGLLNIFAGVVAIIVKVNALKFGTRIAALVGHLKNMVNPIKAIQLRYQSLNDAIGVAKTKVELYKKALESSTTAEEIAANKKRLLRAENELTNASYAKLATTFSYVLTAITAVVAVYSYLTQKQEENYQAILNSATAASENASSLEKLIEQYKNLASASGGTYLLAEQEAEARDIQDQIVALVGDQKNGLDLVNGAIDTQIQKLEQVRGVQNEITKQQAQIAYDAAKAASAKGMYGTGGGGRATLGGYIDFIKGYFGTLFQSISGGAKSAIEEAYATIGEDSPFANGGSLVGLLGGSAREDIATIDSIIETILRANTAAAAMGETLDNSGVLVFLNALREQLQGVVDTENKMGDALYKALAPETIKEYFDQFDMEADGAQEAFDAYIRTLNNPNVTLFNADGSIMSREVRDALIEAAYELFPDLAKAVNLYDTSLSEGAQANGLFATSLEKLKEQMSDYTSQIDGVQSSLKTLQGIVSEYNETGLMSVDMVQQLLELDPEYVALLDFTANGLQMNEEATRKLIDAKKELIDASIALKSAEMADALASEYNAYATDAEYDAAQKASTSATAAASGLKSLINSAYASGYSVQALAQKLYELGYVQDASGSKALAMANDVLTASRAMYNYGAAAQFASSSLSSLATWTGSSTGTKSSGGGGGGGGEDPQIKILEDRKKAVEEEAQAQIDALKKVQDAEDRKRKHDDYAADRSKALQDVRRAQSRSGVDARQDEYEAEKKLADLDKDWQEQLHDWNLDDQIAAIEEWKDAMVEAIDAQIEALRSAGGGGGGGGGVVSNAFKNEAEVLTQNKEVLLAALLEMDNENLSERIKAFYQLFDASQYTSDVDFGDQLAGIKTDWDTFTSENGDDWAIHYKMVLDDGTSMTQEQIDDYINGLIEGGGDILQKDQGAGGLGLLLRVTPNIETNKETEDQWSQTINDLGEALDKMLGLWEFDNLDLDATKKAIEDAFNNAFDAAEQSATDSGVVIEEQMAKSADDTGASMLAAVNGYSPQIVDAWNNNLVNPMITSLGDLSGTLDGILGQLGQVASFGGLTGINGTGGTTNNTTQSQNNFVTLRGSGRSQIDPLRKWFL